MKTFGIGLLVAAWTAGTVAAFWNWEGRYLRPAARPAGAAAPLTGVMPPVACLETDRGRIALAGPEPVTVLNFWNPDCPCSRFAEADVRRLERRYGPQGVRFLTVIAAEDPARSGDALRAWRARGISRMPVCLDRDQAVARAFGVWADPAAVILDQRGKIAYVGAYNAARYCRDPRTAWAALGLAAILRGGTPVPARTPFYGCQTLPVRG